MIIEIKQLKYTGLKDGLIVWITECGVRRFLDAIFFQTYITDDFYPKHPGCYWMILE